MRRPSWPERTLRPGLGTAIATVAAVFVLAVNASRVEADAPPSLQVSGACLIDAGTGQELYARNPAGELQIASTTKLMTSLVVLDRVGRLSRMFTQNNFVPAAADSQIGLLPGERMSVHDLMLAMMLPSADDAAEDLAYNVGGGSIERFVAMMNARARMLGLAHTHYSTPIGLDTPSNYSSPCDLVALARYDLRHSFFFGRMVAARSAELKSGRYPRSVVNRNDLLSSYPWINGVKTGHTTGAGYVLVVSGTRRGVTLIGSVLGTSSAAARDANALALLGWGFANFHPRTLLTGGTVVARLPVKDRPGVRAAVIAATGFTHLLGRGERVTRAVKLPQRLAGPLPRHAVVGQLLIDAGARRLATIPLLLARRVRPVSELTLAGRFFTRGSTLVVLGLALAALCTFVLRRERSRGSEPVGEQSA